MCNFRILAVPSFLPGTKHFFHGFSLFWVLVTPPSSVIVAVTPPSERYCCLPPPAQILTKNCEILQIQDAVLVGIGQQLIRRS